VHPRLRALAIGAATDPTVEANHPKAAVVAAKFHWWGMVRNVQVRVLDPWSVQAAVVPGMALLGGWGLERCCERNVFRPRGAVPRGTSGIRGMVGTQGLREVSAEVGPNNGHPGVPYG
jgi:hypothetical protein